MPGHVICIAGQKGGTGKTVTAVNLAASLAACEKRTLLVDCDPQGSATTGLGINKKKLSYHLFHVLNGNCSLEDAALRDIRLQYLHVVPTTFQLFNIKKVLTDEVANFSHLNVVLRQATQYFDYILLDTPPSLGVLALNAIVAADWLILPVQYQLFAMEGLGQLLLMVKRLKTRVNPKLKIAGILFTMTDKSQSVNSPFDQNHLNIYQDIVFSTRIPRDEAFYHAINEGRPLLLKDITSDGAKAYLDLTAELILKIKALTPGEVL